MLDFFNRWTTDLRERPCLGNRLALIVEDDPELHRAMSRFLVEKEHMKVLPAFDYQGAIHHLGVLVPDVACIDLGLPRESGYELCEYIRRTPHLVELPIVVTSEHGSPEDMAHAEDVGANAFLAKPFRMTELEASIECLLHRTRVSRPGLRLLRPP